MNKDIVFMSILLVIYFVPVCLCKPAFQGREIRISKEQNPCHINDSDTSAAIAVNKTELHLNITVGRIEGLRNDIETVKEEITNGGQIVEVCVLIKFSHQAVNLSCTNIAANNEKEMAECFTSIYQVISQYSTSIKAIEKDEESNGSLDDVINLLEEVDIYTHSYQILCDMYIDLKHLGYNISYHKIPQRKNTSIYNKFVAESKAKQYDRCYHVGSKLNRIQILHVIYQLLDTYTAALHVIQKIFTDTSISSATTTSTPKKDHDIDQIIIG